MTETAELEAALDAAWTLDNLQVYGDHLQQLGDPRGELIGIDVAIARTGSTPVLAHRRRRFLRSWLGLEPNDNPTRGVWSGVTFAYGFIEDCRMRSAMQILATPAAPFVRGITLDGHTGGIEHVIAELARVPRPWLTRLTLAPRFRGDPPGNTWRGELPNIANKSFPSLIANTPRLARLELAGHRLVKDFPHPALRELRVAGIDALLPLLEARQPMPEVTSLSLAFARELGAPVVLARPWPSLLPAASLPALDTLDLSSNEGQRSTTDTQVGVFDVLDSLGILEQLEVLRLPSIRNGHEAQLVQRALDRMPQLERLEVMRGWGKHPVHHERAECIEVPVAAPRYEAPDTELWFLFAHHPTMQFGRVHDALRLCERVTLDDDARAAWTELWELIAALPDEDSPPRSIAAGTLAVALEALGYLDQNVNDAHHFARLRDHVRAAAAESLVWIARRRRQLER
ncbi:MAG: hypothetical protein H0V17_02715 [Deltaproteobacteria bacterium]|nr:hypothetical protein [Deltaproteobacteria bacterium]